ncbi:hypothetical protein [Galbibacter orientalis]
MHPTADTWQTLIIAVTYTAEMGGGEKWQSCVFYTSIQVRM